jgi:hypothetical protein
MNNYRCWSLNINLSILIRIREEFYSQASPKHLKKKIQRRPQFFSTKGIHML